MVNRGDVVRAVRALLDGEASQEVFEQTLDALVEVVAERGVEQGRLERDDVAAHLLGGSAEHVREVLARAVTRAMPNWREDTHRKDGHPLLSAIKRLAADYLVLLDRGGSLHQRLKNEALTANNDARACRVAMSQALAMLEGRSMTAGDQPINEDDRAPADWLVEFSEKLAERVRRQG